MCVITYTWTCDIHVYMLHVNIQHSLHVLLLILFTYIELHPDVKLEITRIETTSGQRRVIFHTSVSTHVYEMLCVIQPAELPR